MKKLLSLFLVLLLVFSFCGCNDTSQTSEDGEVSTKTKQEVKKETGINLSLPDNLSEWQSYYVNMGTPFYDISFRYQGCYFTVHITLGDFYINNSDLSFEWETEEELTIQEEKVYKKTYQANIVYSWYINGASYSLYYTEASNSDAEVAEVIVETYIKNNK